MTKKIHSKTSFELCYLRHTYLRKTKYKPTKEEYSLYTAVIHGIASKTYSTYKKLFYAVGFDFIDIVRIAETTLAPFLEFYNIEVDIYKFEKFVELFCKKNLIIPNEKDILDKNKAIYTLMLKQRMETLVRVCRQKVRDVRGVPMQEYHLFCGPSVPNVDRIELITNYSKYNLKKVDPSIFRSIKKKAKPENSLTFQFNNAWYMAIPTNYKPLELIDFHNTILDPREQSHTQNPEEVILLSESTEKWDREYRKFKKISREKKIDMVRSFIDSNKNSSIFKEEVHLARKMLARMGE